MLIRNVLPTNRQPVRAHDEDPVADQEHPEARTSRPDCSSARPELAQPFDGVSPADQLRYIRSPRREIGQAGSRHHHLAGRKKSSNCRRFLRRPADCRTPPLPRDRPKQPFVHQLARRDDDFVATRARTPLERRHPQDATRVSWGGLSPFSVSPRPRDRRSRRRAPRRANRDGDSPPTGSRPAAWCCRA